MSTLTNVLLISKFQAKLLNRKLTNRAIQICKAIDIDCRLTQDTFVCVIMYSTSVNLIKEQNPATTFIKLKSPLFKALRLFFTVHGSAVHKYALPINSMKTIYNRLMECCDLV